MILALTPAEVGVQNSVRKSVEWDYDPFVSTILRVSYRDGVSSPFLYATPMLGTALVRIFTGEGFVVSADGRRTSKNTGNIITDQQQKIFYVEGRGRSLAYALTGAGYIEGEHGEFNLSAEVEQAASVLANRYPAGLVRYADRFSRVMHNAILEAKKDGRIGEEFPDLDQEGTIARLLFTGYYERQPSWAEIRFFHQAQKLRFPALESKTFSASQTEIQIKGSDKIWHVLLETDEPEFALYRSVGFQKVREKQNLSLADAIELAQNYIHACTDPRAMRLDQLCATIGGHIHTATITPQEGFKWIVPPYVDG